MHLMFVEDSRLQQQLLNTLLRVKISHKRKSLSYHITRINNSYTCSGYYEQWKLVDFRIVSKYIFVSILKNLFYLSTINI